MEFPECYFKYCVQHGIADMGIADFPELKDALLGS
jgi:hypothetical protein